MPEYGVRWTSWRPRQWWWVVGGMFWALGCAPEEFRSEVRVVAPDERVVTGGRLEIPAGQDRARPEGEGGGTREGLWFDARRDAPGEMSEELRAQIERLESIGYVDGQHLPSGRPTVARFDTDRSALGYNFYTSGHGPVAILCDMQGQPIHTWSFPFRGAFSKTPTLESSYYRRAHLYDNGDILAIFEGQGIIKLDRDSRLLWSNPLRTHHDLQVTPHGDIYVLTREARLIREINPELPILEDFISILGPDGREKRRVSVLQAVRESRFADLFINSELQAGDVFHTNTVEVLDGRFAERAPWLKAGNVLTSLHVLDAVVVIDMEIGRVVKAWLGTFRKQHDPKVLENGNILLFDNRGPGDQASTVLEFDPETAEIAWEFRGSEDEPFYTRTCGTVQRLANGNTLVTESDYGRVLEVTADRTVVWEFHNPHRAGPNDEFVAALFEMVRVPSDFPLDWLPRP